MSEVREVSLECPDCGVMLTSTARIETHGSAQGLMYVLTLPQVEHRCAPPEPSSFGARVTVTREDGSKEYRLRGLKGWWLAEDQPPEMRALRWDDLRARGFISLGWG